MQQSRFQLIFFLDMRSLALGLNNWIDPSVESLGEFYWGDENADDAGLPGLWFP
jgi:hypothetical protein